MTRLCLIATVLAMVTLAPDALAAPEPTRAEIGEAARRIVAQDDYQKELVQPPELRLRRRSRGSGGCGSSSLPTLLLWIGAAVVAGLALMWVAAQFRGRVGSNPEASAPDEGGGGEAAPWRDATMDEVDRLARAGAWGEAAHELLLLTVRKLSALRELDPAASLTARELTSLLTTGSRERDLFRRLVRAVELSLFGGRPLDEPAFRDCRAAHDELLRSASDGRAA